jgi:hypothetical protein
LPNRERLDECSQPTIFYSDEPEFESATKSSAFAIQRFGNEGRPPVKMVVNSLVKSAFASHGSSDMCHPALRIIDYIDALKMGDG